MSKSSAEYVLDEIRRRGIQHRKGFTADGPDIHFALRYLMGEIAELQDAILEQQPLEAQRDELGDVFACVLQVGTRLGMTFADIDAAADRKMRLRWPGADMIPQEADLDLDERTVPNG